MFSKLKAHLNTIVRLATIAAFTVGVYYLLRGDLNFQSPSSVDSYRIKMEEKYALYYALLSLVRIAIALVVSVFAAIFIGKAISFSEGTLKIGLAVIDVLQSIPINGFLSLSVSLFINLFPNSIIGAQIAVIFALITDQIWNLIFSVCESLQQLKSYRHIIEIYKLSKSYVFWHLELPLMLPGLIWNTGLSLSASWFLIVASEELIVGNIRFAMPGLGGFILESNRTGHIACTLWAMAIICASSILCSLLILQPLLKLCRNLKVPKSTGLVDCLNAIAEKAGYFLDQVLERANRLIHLAPAIQLLLISGFLAMVFPGYRTLCVILPRLIVSFARIVIVLVISSIISLPVGIALSRNEKVLKVSQVVFQTASAIPINIFYSFFFLVHPYIGSEVSCIILMSIGAIWCVLFNIIDSVEKIDSNYWKMRKVFKMSRFDHFKNFIAPCIAPSYMTGLLAASGAAWNASVICEYISWKKDIIGVYGIGSYISLFGDNSYLLTSSILVLSIFIYYTNLYCWTPLLKHVNSLYSSI